MTMIALLIFLFRLDLPFKPEHRLEAENAALRQQATILQRKCTVAFSSRPATHGLAARSLPVSTEPSTTRRVMARRPHLRSGLRLVPTGRARNITQGCAQVGHLSQRLHLMVMCAN